MCTVKERESSQHMRLSYDVETPLALSGESLRKRVAKPRGRIREGPEGVLIESGLLPLTDSLTSRKNIRGRCRETATKYCTSTT
jgi:hypothetical protein